MLTRTTRHAKEPTNDVDAVHNDNARPPVCAVIGRKTRQVRIRVMKNTQGITLCPFVERFTHPKATLYTDEYDSYNQLKRVRHTVCHAKNEYARDDDGDGIREVHVNTCARLV